MDFDEGHFLSNFSAQSKQKSLAQFDDSHLKNLASIGFFGHKHSVHRSFSLALIKIFFFTSNSMSSLGLPDIFES